MHIFVLLFLTVRFACISILGSACRGAMLQSHWSSRTMASLAYLLSMASELCCCPDFCPLISLRGSKLRKMVQGLKSSLELPIHYFLRWKTLHFTHASDLFECMYIQTYVCMFELSICFMFSYVARIFIWINRKFGCWSS